MNKILVILLLGLALAFTSCDDILVPDIGGEDVNLLAPVDGYIADSTAVILWWDFVPSAIGYTVTVVSTGFDNIETLALEEIVEGNNQLSVNLPSGRYEWSVSAYNDAYATDGFFRSLIVVDGTSDIRNIPTTITAPAADVCLTASDVDFTWSALAGAENYRLQIATPDFGNDSNIVSDRLIDGLSDRQTLSVGNYAWRVRGENNLVIGKYTTTPFKVQ